MCVLYTVLIKQKLLNAKVTKKLKEKHQPMKFQSGEFLLFYNEKQEDVQTSNPKKAI